MEGLEITIQNYNELEKIIDYRIEAEYFDKRFLRIDKIFENQKYVTFFDIADYENGRAYSSDEFYEGEGGVKVSKIGDVTQKRPNENWFSVSEKEFIKQRGNYLVDSDILMTLTGDPPDVGKVNLFISNELKSTWNQRVARIFLKENQNIFLNHKVLYIILSTHYCREQLERFAKGIRQRNLGTECIEQLKLPVLSDAIQLKTNSLVENSIENLTKSQTHYRQAEELLLETIGLKDFTPSQEKTNIKTLKKSFLSTGRLDAEYYQSKYEEIENKIKSQPHTFVVDVFNLNENLIDYKSSKYNYIEIGDVNVGSGAYSYNLIETSELPANAKIQSKRGDLLISKVRPNRGAISIIQGEITDLVVSGAFTVLEEKADYKKETLFILLRTKQYREWMLKYNVGTSYPVIKDEDILNLPIPIINLPTQQQISALIQESFALRKESERLLSEAKEMVEREIEM